MNRTDRRRLAKTTPPSPDESLQQAVASHQSGDLRTAEKRYRAILAAKPHHPEATRLLGEVLIDTGRLPAAIALLRQLANAHPGHFNAQYSLGNAYRLAGHTTEAIAAYQAAIVANPQFSGAYHGLGAAQRTLGRHQFAADAFAAAARLNPRWALAWNDLGMTLAALGKLDIATAALERALALDPTLADTRRHLLAIRDTSTPDDIATLQTILRDPALPPDALIESHFALGKLLDKAARHDEAFHHFVTANQALRQSLAAAGIIFNRARLATDIDKLIATFTPGAIAAFAGFGTMSEIPVFIVGMPRSGTTLVEQIAASHSNIFGAGELKSIGAIAATLGWNPSPLWSQTSLHDAAEFHLAALATSASGGQAIRVIDKMPDNIFQLGVIACLFPAARIIFCERDPVDTCFSCYTQRFAEPHGYDTDLADCGFRHREIDRLTRHWQATLPLRMLRVSYEALIQNPETESRKLIAFLGLDWDPACLAFHRTERTVTTASWAQIRRPLYTHAIGRAKPYTPHLKPLHDALK